MKYSERLSALEGSHVLRFFAEARLLRSALDLVDKHAKANC